VIASPEGSRVADRPVVRCARSKLGCMVGRTSSPSASSDVVANSGIAATVIAAATASFSRRCRRLALAVNFRIERNVSSSSSRERASTSMVGASTAAPRLPVPEATSSTSIQVPIRVPHTYALPVQIVVASTDLTSCQTAPPLGMMGGIGDADGLIGTPPVRYPASEAALHGRSTASEAAQRVQLDRSARVPPRA
jgi:hypothetical protein